MALYADWDAFTEFAAAVTTSTGPLIEADLRNPVPSPRQVFAIGLNYRSHAEESGMSVPEVPAVFTKFPASLAGPYDDVTVVSHAVDWEAELVVVVGRRRRPALLGQVLVRLRASAPLGRRPRRDRQP